MGIEEKIKVVEKLQATAFEVFKEVTSVLLAEKSEAAIADAVNEAYRRRGIVEHWYDVPHNVLIAVDRFKEGTTTTDYSIKNPSKDSILKDGSIVYIDMSPMDPKTKIWGDWSSTIVFHPRKGIDDEQVQFLDEFRAIQRSGIPHFTSQTTGAEICRYYTKAYKQRGITLLDVRSNVGHSIHDGPKDKANRIWLDVENNIPLGEGIFTIEPGGYKAKTDGKGDVIARFEDCIYIPKEGPPILLGNKELPPLTV